MNFKITNMPASFRVERMSREKYDALSNDCQLANGNIISVETFAVRRFPARKKKITVDGVTMTSLIYQSGGVVLVGAKSEYQVKMAAQQLEAFLSTKIIQEPKISTIAASCDFKQRFRLGKLASFLIDNHIKKCEWYDLTEEFFPALRVRVYQKQSPVYLIFSTGKVIITGCKTIASTQHHYDLIKLLITDYNKHN